MKYTNYQMSESLPTPAIQAVSLSTLGSGSKVGPLTWSGSAWSAQSVSTCSLNGPSGGVSVTATGTAGRITFVLVTGGGAFGITTPMSITVSNTSVSAGDLIFANVEFSNFIGKEVPVWCIVRNVSSGSFIIQLLSTTAHPFVGAEDLYIDYYVLKA